MYYNLYLQHYVLGHFSLLFIYLDSEAFLNRKLRLELWGRHTSDPWVRIEPKPLHHTSVTHGHPLFQVSQTATAYLHLCDSNELIRL